MLGTILEFCLPQQVTGSYCRGLSKRVTSRKQGSRKLAFMECRKYFRKMRGWKQLTGEAVFAISKGLYTDYGLFSTDLY